MSCRVRVEHQTSIVHWRRTLPRLPSRFSTISTAIRQESLDAYEGSKAKRSDPMDSIQMMSARHGPDECVVRYIPSTLGTQPETSRKAATKISGGELKHGEEFRGHFRGEHRLKMYYITMTSLNSQRRSHFISKNQMVVVLQWLKLEPSVRIRVGSTSR